MSKLFSRIFTAIASLGAGAGTTGCYVIWLDEPEMPKSLIEK